MPNPALSVSVAALVVALGGTSYAAGLIGGEDVRNSSLTGKDVKNKSLTGKDVKNRSLKAKDLKKGTLAKGGRWVLVNAAGQIEAQSGGFEITAAYPLLPPTASDPTGERANGNVYIDANEPLNDNGVVATIALQNQVDQNADGNTNGRAPADMNFEFAGEISASQCQIPGFVACGPTAAQDINNLVVSPRNSDGTVTENNLRKRFYVVLTGDSSDYVAP